MRIRDNGFSEIIAEPLFLIERIKTLEKDSQNERTKHSKKDPNGGNKKMELQTCSTIQFSYQRGREVVDFKEQMQ